MLTDSVSVVCGYENEIIFSSNSECIVVVWLGVFILLCVYLG